MKVKTVISLLLMAALILTLAPAAALADAGYAYIDENGNTKTTEALTVTTITADTATLSSGWYVVDSDVARNGTITVSGSVNLILADGVSLSVTGDSRSAGIAVLNGNSLTIYGQAAGTGTLSAQGGQYGAGIGGGYYANAGNTTIIGGTVIATGGEDGAGIGGGCYANGGTIRIIGGTVTANGNADGAGIGGGHNGQSGSITVSGGVVHATSGDVSIATGAAGIGGGAGKAANRITISGGTVIATALDYGAGIGGGAYGGGGLIEIAGGEVTASSRYRGAGIGGGNMASGGTTTISGGTVDAASGYGGAGIGGGCLAAGGTINIQGGDITARGGSWGAGIGSAGEYDAGDITISGGVVKAYAGDYNTGIYSGSAGIGAGGELEMSGPPTHTGGTIKILGGNVTAGGAYNSLDIGRGRNGVNGSLLIDDAAIVTLAAKGIDASAATLGTCIIKGAAADTLSGAYDHGAKLDGTLIDLSDPALGSGVGYTVSGDHVVLGSGGSSFILYGSTSSRRIVISPGTGTNTTLFDAVIRPVSGCAFHMTGTTVNMRLVSHNDLVSGDDFAGIQAAAGSVLNISGSGSLTVTGGNNGAGIGGGDGMSAGSISFTGGTVEAVGNGGGAGVGGGNGGGGGVVLADGESTTVSARGGAAGTDIGSGSGNSTGGSLTMQHGAAVNLMRNGTNANASFVAGKIGGKGAGLLAGTYRGSQKLLTCIELIASPASGAKAFDDIMLTATVEGLSETDPQGQVAFFYNGKQIGRASLARTGAGSAAAAAQLNWVAWGGSNTITAQYVQNETAESYYMTVGGRINGYLVSRIDQASLSIAGVPDTVTYGDAPFKLAVGGGSGTGSLSYAVTAGGAVSANASTGVVTVKNAGSATVTVTKAADSNYNQKSASVTITVGRAIPAVVFPAAASITYGQSLSDSVLTGGIGDGSFAWENPDTAPAVINSGFTVVFTPSDSSNYTTVERTVELVVCQAAQAPLAVGGIPDSLTFGDAPFRLTVDGGSGTGTLSYTVIPGNTVSVDAAGMVTIMHAGAAEIEVTRSGDDNYLPVSHTLLLTVYKAAQSNALTFEMPESIAYGDAPFQMIGNGGSGSGAFGYSVTSGDAVAVSEAGMVTVLRPGEAVITAVKAGNEDYLSQTTALRLSVDKGIQNTLIISGIPARVVTGHAPFMLAVSGGSGTGGLSYAVTSGNSVSVDEHGIVAVLKRGAAVLSVTKAEDEYYLAATATAGITVRSEPAVEETPSASPAPSVPPAAIAVPSPTSTAAIRPSATHAPSSRADSDGVWQNGTVDRKTGFVSMLIWIAAGVFVLGGITTAILIFLSKKKR